MMMIVDWLAGPPAQTSLNCSSIYTWLFAVFLDGSAVLL